MYAKQKNGIILKYPYFYEDLQIENPNTRFDNRFSLPEWYLKTEDAINIGAEIVEVIETPAPQIDFSSFDIEMKQIPELINGIWQLNWIVKEKTEEEKEFLRLNQLSGTPQ